MLQVIDRVRLETLIELPDLFGPVANAFVAYSTREANVPPVQHVEMPENDGAALHIKSAYVSSLHCCLVKVVWVRLFWNSSLGIRVRHMSELGS